MLSNMVEDMNSTITVTNKMMLIFKCGRMVETNWAKNIGFRKVWQFPSACFYVNKRGIQNYCGQFPPVSSQGESERDLNQIHIT